MLAEASEIGHAGNTQTELVQLCFGDLIADGGPIGATENDGRSKGWVATSRVTDFPE